MQDLAAAVKALKDASAVLQTGGVIVLLAFIAILAFILLKPVLARGRKATNEIHVGIPSALGPSNGNGRVCLQHSGIEAQLRGLDKYLEENTRQHGKLFDGLDDVSHNLAGLTEAVENLKRP